MFFLKKRDFENAYKMMDSYIDCARQPLFTDLHYDENDSLCISSAFWTIICGYKLNDFDQALKYLDIAMKGDRYKNKILHYLVEIYQQKYDTVNYLKALHDGFDLDKKTSFFFTRLVDYYNNENQLDSALNIINSALESDGNNTLFLSAKSSILLNMGQYPECIEVSDKALAIDESLTDVYFNAGISYFNQAVLLENDVKLYKTSREQILDFYRKALPYLESYRQLAPDQKEKWASPLYNIYFNLNMGSQFEEISKVVQELKQ